VQEYQDLFNFDPPVTEEKTRRRHFSLSARSRGWAAVETNEALFLAAVEDITAIRSNCSIARNQCSAEEIEEEAAKAKARGLKIWP
jgi:hypothetical protein